MEGSTNQPCCFGSLGSSQVYGTNPCASLVKLSNPAMSHIWNELYNVIRGEYDEEYYCSRVALLSILNRRPDALKGGDPNLWEDERIHLINQLEMGFRYAMKLGKSDEAFSILQHCSACGDIFPTSPFLTVCEFGTVMDLVTLIAQRETLGLPINDHAFNGENALFGVCRRRGVRQRATMFKMLVRGGADVDCTSLEDETPLSLSILHGDLCSAWTLLHLGARAGNGPLYWMRSFPPSNESSLTLSRNRVPLLPEIVVRKMKVRLLNLGNLGLLYAASHYAGMELDPVTERSLNRTAGRIWRGGFKPQPQYPLRWFEDIVLPS